MTRQASFADWYWWTIMTALAAALAIVLYVVLRAEQRGFSPLWVGLPLVVAYCGAPLSPERKARWAVFGIPALSAPAVLLTFAVFTASPMGDAVSDLSALPRMLFLSRDEAVAEDALRALRADPATAGRVRACEMVLTPVNGAASAVDRSRLYECATAGR